MLGWHSEGRALNRSCWCTGGGGLSRAGLTGLSCGSSGSSWFVHALSASLMHIFISEQFLPMVTVVSRSGPGKPCSASAD